MIAASANVIALLKAVELGLTTLGNAIKMIQRAREEGRDLTEEEMNAVDASADYTDDQWQDALARKRARGN